MIEMDFDFNFLYTISVEVWNRFGKENKSKYIEREKML